MICREIPLLERELMNISCVKECLPDGFEKAINLFSCKCGECSLNQGGFLILLALAVVSVVVTVVVANWLRRIKP